MLRYSLDTTPKLYSLVPQHFYAGSVINFRYNRRRIHYERFNEIKIGKNICPPSNDEFYSYGGRYDVINKCTIGDVFPEEAQDFMINHNIGLPSVNQNIYKEKINQEVFSFAENTPENAKVFNEEQNIKNLFVANNAFSEGNNNNNQNSYAFKVFPVIKEISNREISPNGNNLLKIKGQGFFPDQKNTEIFIDDKDTKCEIKEISTDEILCETKKFSENLQKKIIKYANETNSENSDTMKKLNFTVFPGSPGFLRKIYRNKISRDGNNLNEPDDIDISLELRTEYNWENPGFTQTFEGYFKAPISSDYKFYAATDDECFIYLWIDGEKKLVLNIKSWGTEFDFVSTEDKKSDWVSLKGGNMYYMEILHMDGAGVYHFSLGVEIKNPKYLIDDNNKGKDGKLLRLVTKNNFNRLVTIKDNEPFFPKTKRFYKEDLKSEYEINKEKISIKNKSTNKTRNLQVNNKEIFNYENQVPLVQKLLIEADQKSHEVYQAIFQIQKNENPTNFKLICKNKNSQTNIKQPYNTLSFDISDSAKNLRNNFSNFLGERRLNFLTAKITKDLKFIKDTIEIITWNPSIKFEDYFLSKKIEISEGEIFGNIFLILLENRPHEISNFNEDCSFSPSDSDVKINFEKIQENSKKLNGYFKLKIIDEDNKEFVSENINVFTEELDSHFKAIEYLNDKMQILKYEFHDYRAIYYIRLDLHSNKKLQLESHFIKGGNDDKISITFEDIIPKTENLFFYPIPADFLMKKNTSPQLRIISNKIEAACIDCSMKIISQNITVNEIIFKKDENKISIKLSDSFPKEEKLILKIGKILKDLKELSPEDKTNLRFLEDTNKIRTEFFCILEKEEIIGGDFSPEIITSKGSLKTSEEISKFLISFEIFVEKIEPKNLPFSGGAKTKIFGKNFPRKNSEENLKISLRINSKICEVIDYDVDFIEFYSPEKPGNLQSSEIDLFIYVNEKEFKFNSENLFTFDDNRNFFVIDSISPNNLAPGEKKNLVVKFNKELTEYKIEDLIAEMKSVNNDNNIIKEYPMKLFFLEKNEIHLIYSGAPLGDYIISIKNKQASSIISSTNFKVFIEINSITPNSGSIEGGTLLNIKGKNFLPKELNQVIYIKNLICSYVNVTSTEINCITKKAPKELYEKENEIVIDQLLKYESICKAQNCKFLYTKEKTSIVNEIKAIDKNTNLDSLSTNSQIEIFGENFYFDKIPYELNFSWGKLIVENIKNSENSEKLKTLTCKISEIFSGNYKPTYLDFFDSNGNSILLNKNSPTGKFLVNFVYENPQIIKIKPEKFVNPFGSIFEIEFNSIEGFKELAKNKKHSPATLDLCGNVCELKFTENFLKDNLNNLGKFVNNFYNNFTNSADENFSEENKNLMKCDFKQVKNLKQSNLDSNLFNNCEIKILNYFNKEVKNANSGKINLKKTEEDFLVRNILINGIDRTQIIHRIGTLEEKLTKFTFVIELPKGKNTLEEEKDLKLLLNDYLIILMEKESNVEIKEIDGKEIYYLNAEFILDSSKFYYGEYEVSLYQSNFGYLKLTEKVFNRINDAIYFKISLDFQKSNNETKTFNSTFNGGKEINIPIANINFNERENMQISICGIRSLYKNLEIIKSSNKENSQISEGLNFETIRILNINTNHFENILLKKPIDLTENLNTIFSTFPVNDNYRRRLFDNDPYTNFHELEYAQISLSPKIAKNFGLFLNYLIFHTTESASINALLGAKIEACEYEETNTTEEKTDKFVEIMTIENEFVTFDNKKIIIKYEDKDSNKIKKYYRSFRIKFPQKNSQISEIRFFGNIIYEEKEENNITNPSLGKKLTCDLNLINSYGQEIPLPEYSINYLEDLTIKADLKEKIFDIIGKENKNITLQLTSNTKNLNESAIKISAEIYNTPIEDNLIFYNFDKISDSYLLQINFKNFLPHQKNEKNGKEFDIKKPLRVTIEEIGEIFFPENSEVELYFRWSDTNSWGGDFVPGFKDTVYIKNLNILFDVGFAELNFLLVENGKLKFEDKRDYKILCNNILIRSGAFILGTEDKKFENNFDLEMTTRKNDPTLPVFGNKVLAVMEGTLDIHGKKLDFTWSILAKTANPGDDFIYLQDKVDWKINDEIVIASSSMEPKEAESFFIKEIEYLNEEQQKQIIDSNNINNPKPLTKLTLSAKIKNFHYGDLEFYENLSTKKTTKADFRSEVGLLTRNIKIHGDKKSINEKYGCHIMLAGFKEDPSIGRIEYAEIYHAGQAFQMGRYPIHFHMLGSIPGSYVRGCGIYNTFNRALTIHGVHNFLVERNVAYNIFGHTFFMEDAIETRNIVRQNLGILTKKSFSLLNSDTTPATFWITNPFNFYEGNRAAGSEEYGFWLEFPERPTGLSTKSKACPQEFPLGSFRENSSHSNLKYGIRIFPMFNPKNKPCEEFSKINAIDIPYDESINNVMPTQATFEKITSWKNKEKAIVAEGIGNVHFKEIITADNGESGIEISKVINFPGGRPEIRDSTVIGISKNPTKNLKKLNFRGIVTARTDNYLISNISFFSFNNTNPGNNDILANFGSCSRCEIAEPATDSGARTIDFEKLYFDGTEKKRVIWNYPYRAIYKDLDGSLISTDKNNYNSGWATPYHPHNKVAECKIEEKFDSGLVCDETIQIRRIAFSEGKPDALSQKKIKIWRFFNNEEKDSALINKFMTEENKNNFTELEFKKNRDPENGWAVPFVTNYDYAISFANGINFDEMKISRSVFWENTDKPINLVFNYTSRRDDYEVMILGEDNKEAYKINETINLFDKEIYQKKYNENLIKFGAKSFNKDKTEENNSDENKENNSTKLIPNLFMLHINGKDFIRKFPYQKNNELSLKIKAIPCLNNICNKPPVIKPLENRTRLWSDPESWDDKKVPTENSDIEIKAGWNMVLDKSIPPINFLTINGKLTISDEKIKPKINKRNLQEEKIDDTIELKAKIVLIKTGSFQVGNKTHPFEGKFKLTLNGIQTDPIFAFDNKMKFSNNMLLNLNKLELFGKDRSPYVSRLQKSAKKGDKEIYVDKNLKWLPNDEIILSTSSHDFEETEIFVIKSYDKNSGKIEILKAQNSNDNEVKYSHYGSEQVKIITDINLENFSNFDERAEVILLTRDIKIGSDREKNWGGHFQSVKMDININNTLYSFPGEFNISNVEFINMGQTVEFSAIVLKNVMEGNLFENNSLHSIRYAGLEIIKANDFNVKNFVVYSPLKFGVKILESENVEVSGSYVFNLKLDALLIESKQSTYYDGAGFVICINSSCKNVYLRNNKNIGSEFAGFMYNGFDCKDNKLSEMDYNYATACKYGFVIDKSETYDCLKAGKVVAFNNYLWGLMVVPGSKSINIEDVFSSNNLKGIGIFPGSKIPLSEHSLKRAYVIGQNPENPICISEKFCEKNCYQSGFIASTTSIGGKTMPYTTNSLPLNSIMGDAQFGSFFTIDNITFFNFNNECPYSSVAISSNEGSMDAFSIHNFNNAKFKNIFKTNLIKLKRNYVDKKIVTGICGDFPCTGLNNIIFNFNSITESKDEVITYNKKVEKFEIKNSSDKNKEKINDINTFSSGLTLTSIIDNLNFKENSICEELPNSDSLLCSSDYSSSHLIMENIEKEAKDRSLHPVYVTSKNLNFTNKLNSFGDHDCRFGYDSLIRTPRFPALVMLKKNEINSYEVSFTSTNPNKLIVQLISEGEKFSQKKISKENNNMQIMKIQLKYNGPMTVLVFNNKKEVKADIFNGNSTDIDLKTFDGELCGKNNWNTLKNLLEFYVTNESDCKLQLNIVNSIKVSIRYDVSVEEFFSTKGPYDLRAKTAAVLGIEPSRVKIASIIKGSTKVEFSVLEKSVDKIIEEDEKEAQEKEDNVNNNSTNNNTNNDGKNATNTDDASDSNNDNNNGTKFYTLDELMDSVNDLVENKLGENYTILDKSVKKISRVIIDNEINNKTDETDIINNKTDDNTKNETEQNKTDNGSDLKPENKTEEKEKEEEESKLHNNWYIGYVVVIIVFVLILVICIFKTLRNFDNEPEASTDGTLVEDENNPVTMELKSLDTLDNSKDKFE